MFGDNAELLQPTRRLLRKIKDANWILVARLIIAKSNQSVQQRVPQIGAYLKLSGYAGSVAHAAGLRMSELTNPLLRKLGSVRYMFTRV